MPRARELEERAREAERREEFDRAIDLYLASLEEREEAAFSSPDELAIFIRLGDLYLRRGERERAAAFYRDGAEHHAREGHVSRAASLYRKVLRLLPNDLDAHRELARLHAELGALPECREYLQEYLRRVRVSGRESQASDFVRELREAVDDPEVEALATDFLGAIEEMYAGPESSGDTLKDEVNAMHKPWLDEPARERDVEEDAEEAPPEEAAGEMPPVDGDGGRAGPAAQAGAGADVNSGADAQSGETEEAGPTWLDAGPAPESAAEMPAESAGEAPVPSGGPVGDARPEEDAGPQADLTAEAELRNGLEIISDLLDVEPRNLALHRRRAEYARRLGDREAGATAFTEMGDLLRESGSLRAAHVVYAYARTLAPGDPGARRGMARLEAAHASRLGVSSVETSAGAATTAPAGEPDTGDGIAATLWPELERALRDVAWLQAAAARIYGPGGTGEAEGASAATREILGRRFFAREEYSRALEVLEPVLGRSDVGEEQRADVAHLSALACLRTGNRGRAEELFDRVADVDPDFAEMADWLLPRLLEEGGL